MEHLVSVTKERPQLLPSFQRQERVIFHGCCAPCIPSGLSLSVLILFIISNKSPEILMIKTG